MRSVIFIVFSLLGVLFGVSALPLVSDTLGSNMVLQSSPNAAKIWGWTNIINEEVLVKFDGQMYGTVSGLDEFGNFLWSLDLAPTEVKYY